MPSMAQSSGGSTFLINDVFDVFFFILIFWFGMLVVGTR